MSGLIDKVSIPVGKSGDWRVERFSVSRDESLMSSLKLPSRMVLPGEYARLVRGDQTVMSDTLAEMRDHYQPVLNATGNCLVMGLGLGMVASAILKRPGVERLTIIESSPDVLNLVAPHICDSRLTIIQANALEWKPEKGERYQMCWYDIWDDLCTDNLVEMTMLHRRFGRKADWQGSWSKEFLMAQKRREASHLSWA